MTQLDRSTIKLTRVAIADLVPLQSGLRSKTVDEKRRAIRAGEPVNAPLVFRCGKVLYVADGHHTVEACWLEGFKAIQARIIELGSLKLAKALHRKDVTVADPFRKANVLAEGRLRRTFTKVLAEQGRLVAKAFMEHDPAKKADKPDAVGPDGKPIPPAEPLPWYAVTGELDAWIADYITTELKAGHLKLSIALEDNLGSTANKAGEYILGELMPSAHGDLVDRVFDRAVNYSRERTGELIGRSADGAGELMETTRTAIRDAVTKGLEDNVGQREIADMLENDFAFSPDRADLISRTEISNANGAGSHEGLIAAQDAGVVVEHAWIAEDDACEICQANEDEGWIPVDQAFSSGDMNPAAHPNCRCAEAARVVEPAVKALVHFREEAVAVHKIAIGRGTCSNEKHQHPETGTGAIK